MDNVNWPLKQSHIHTGTTKVQGPFMLVLLWTLIVPMGIWDRFMGQLSLDFPAISDAATTQQEINQIKNIRMNHQWQFHGHL